MSEKGGKSDQFQIKIRLKKPSPICARGYNDCYISQLIMCPLNKRGCSTRRKGGIRCGSVRAPSVDPAEVLSSLTPQQSKSWCEGKSRCCCGPSAREAVPGEGMWKGAHACTPVTLRGLIEFQLKDWEKLLLSYPYSEHKVLVQRIYPRTSVGLRQLVHLNSISFYFRFF